MVGGARATSVGKVQVPEPESMLSVSQPSDDRPCYHPGRACHHPGNRLVGPPLESGDKTRTAEMSRGHVVSLSAVRGGGGVVAVGGV
jgi:hypothetical protein